MQQDQFAFHLEEHKSLMQFLMANIKDSYQAALLSVAGNAALISYWLNNRGVAQTLPAAKILLPLISILICLFGLFFYALRRRTLDRMVSYLKLLEQQLGAPHLGWESYYKSDKDSRFFVRTPFVMYSLFTLQFVLVAIFALTLILS